jgi:hypothetical protein
MREATGAIAEMDALLHLAPSVVSLREWIGDLGPAEAVRRYRAGEAPSV